MPPFSGRKPQVIVGPQSSKIVPYKMTDDHATISFKMRASFRKGAAPPPSNNNGRNGLNFHNNNKPSYPTPTPKPNPNPYIPNKPSYPSPNPYNPPAQPRPNPYVNPTPRPSPYGQPKGIRQARTFRGKDVGIAVYTHKHRNGVIITYQNKSKNYELIEKVTFNLQGCRIQGIRGKSLKITLDPGETDVLVVQSYTQNWSCYMSRCRYGVADVKWNWKW